MAQLKLTITADNKADKSVQALKTEVDALAHTLSNIKVNKTLTAQINALTKHYKTISDAHAKIIQNKNKEAIADEKLKQQQSKTALAVAKENTELERQNNIKARTEKITYSLAKAKEKDASKTKITISQTQKLAKEYADLLYKISVLEKSYKKGTFDDLKSNITSYFNDIKGLDDALKNETITQEEYNSRVIQATASLQGFKTEMATTRAESKNLHGTLKDIVSGFFNFQLGAMLVMKPLQLIRSALSSINETLIKTEDSVIALQRVLPSGSASDGEISSRLYKIAVDYGQTFENVSQIAQNFARTGMSWADTIKATEAAVLALNVAELDATEASDGMIAILTQFGLKAEDLTLVVDKLNITADNAAVTTEKLLAALQRTGSSAANANLSLDQTLSIITALSEATGRSGENLGTAVNSLIQYSSKASALDTFAGLSDKSAQVVADYKKGAVNILEVWKQVAKEIEHLDTRQADLLDSYFNTEDGNELKEALDGELQDIYTEMGGVYDTANTFRKNYFIALLGNMDSVLKAEETLKNAQGYSQAENIKYMNTYTAQANSLKATWESLVSDESSWGEFKKGFVGAGNAILAMIEDVGGLQNALIYLVSSIALVSSAFKTLTGGINPIAKLILSLTKGIQNLITRMKSFGGAGKNIISAFKSWKTVIKDVNTYLKANANAQNAAKAAQDALNTSIKLNADSTATAEAKQEAANIATQTKVAADVAATASTEALTVAMGTLSAVVNIVMIAITAAIIVITAIVSAVNAAKQETEQANETLRENSKQLNENVAALNEQNEALFDNIQALEIYIKQVKDVTTSEEERQDALSEIISISGDLLESYGLENDYLLTLTTSYTNLNGELEKYIGLAKELAAEKAAQAYDDAQKASEAATKAKNATRATIDLAGPVTNEAVRRGLIESGITTGMSKEHGRTKGVGVYGAVALDFEATEENLKELEEWYDLIDKRLQSDISSHSRWEATLASSAVLEAIDKIKEALKLEETAAQNELNAWARNELLNTGLADDFYGAQGSEDENYEALKRLQDEIKNNTKYTEEERKALNALVSKELKDYLGKYKAIVDENGKLTNDITKVKGAYEDLISKLEELRDLQKESTEWEEKKLAVMEAEQALENARNEATIRRFNQATGQWEWQTDEKKIAEAEKNLEQAQLNLQETAYSNIIDQLEKETATNESILAILKEVAPLLGQDFADAVQNAIKDKTGVDITKPIIPSTESHDNGGLAIGKGFINKATSQPESVNNPELTKKILSPVSNAEFNRYVRDMGIMFETARQYSQTPIIQRVGGATDNRIDNSGQINFAGGLTVGSDQRNSSLDQVLALFGIMNNNG